MKFEIEMPELLHDGVLKGHGFTASVMPQMAQNDGGLSAPEGCRRANQA
jgi:hypothetical protein